MKRALHIDARLKFAAVALSTTVAQGMLAYRFRVFTFFDLPLIAVVYYGFTQSNPTTAVLAGSVLGLLEDSLSASLLGVNGFSKTLVGFLAASAGSKVAVDQPVTRVAALFLFTIGDRLTVTMVALTVGATRQAPDALSIGGWFLSATFNALLGLIVLELHDRMNHATT